MRNSQLVLAIINCHYGYTQIMKFKKRMSKVARQISAKIAAQISVPGTSEQLSIATTSQLAATTQVQLLASMVLQLNSQSRERAELQKQLVTVNQQLAKVHKVLAQKDHIIDSLEIDLEHVVTQLTRLQTMPTAGSLRTSLTRSSAKKWINRTVPGLSASGMVASA